ncbi:MAG: TraR/DksA family transcriptional regulator [Phaeodactylibacter sp.]|nr:TraR/DksA family transcriptional regulator [Phaeodactylibacter sp.]
MEESKSTARYSDEELEEFRAVIEEKLEKANVQLEQLQRQITETTENSGDNHGSDWMDDSSYNTNMELLNNMAIRQQKFIQDLQNAMVRIRNKTYGICSITGNLISKRRLMAVPTTTKSVSAKSIERKKVPTKQPHRINSLPYVKGKDK